MPEIFYDTLQSNDAFSRVMRDKIRYFPTPEAPAAGGGARHAGTADDQDEDERAGVLLRGFRCHILLSKAVGRRASSVNWTYLFLKTTFSMSTQLSKMIEILPYAVLIQSFHTSSTIRKW